MLFEHDTPGSHRKTLWNICRCYFLDKETYFITEVIQIATILKLGSKHLSSVKNIVVNSISFIIPSWVSRWIHRSLAASNSRTKNLELAVGEDGIKRSTTLNNRPCNVLTEIHKLSLVGNWSIVNRNGSYEERDFWNKEMFSFVTACYGCWLYGIDHHESNS